MLILVALGAWLHEWQQRPHDSLVRRSTPELAQPLSRDAQPPGQVPLARAADTSAPFIAVSTEGARRHAEAMAELPARPTDKAVTKVAPAAAAEWTNIEPPQHAHPLTVQHEALRQQQQLVAGLNDALDLRDASGLRALIERYDELMLDDTQRLREGYERLADCLEAAPAERANARANAQRYYDDARASTLRRHVRRVCLEPSEPAAP